MKEWLKIRIGGLALLLASVNAAAAGWEAGMDVPSLDKYSLSWGCAEPGGQGYIDRFLGVLVRSLQGGIPGDGKALSGIRRRGIPDHSGKRGSKGAGDAAVSRSTKTVLHNCP